MAEPAPLAVERAGGLGELAPGIAHGFFGHGGPEHPRAHQFGYGGPGEVARVAADRVLAANTLVPGAVPVLPHQTHSPDVVVVDEAWDDTPQGRPVGDALVTDRAQLAIGIVTADCAPVLFADGGAGIIGAAHAGWRGAHGGVLENTISAMESLGASRSNIAAAIGPTIAQKSYEVDAPFRDQFAAIDERHFLAAPERADSLRWHFDLSGYIIDKLTGFGIQKIDSVCRDTFSHPERYYSYRKSSQSGEPNYGRQISLIALA